MKKFACMFVLALVALVITGCSTMFNARNTGAMSGVAVYTGYSEVVKSELIGNDLQTRITNLWAEVNKLEKIDDVKATADKLAAAFDEVIASDKLSESQKANLLALKNMVMDKVDTIIDDKLTPNSEAVEFLQGFREGVNACIDASKDVDGKKVTASEAAKTIGKKVAVSAAKSLASKAIDSVTAKKEEAKTEEVKAEATTTEVKAETKVEEKKAEATTATTEVKADAKTEAAPAAEVKK